MALILTRLPGEAIRVGEDIKITVFGIDHRGEVRLAIDAPKEIAVDREEIWQRKQDEMRRAELEQIKGLYVLEFTAGAGGQPICWIAAGTRKAAEELFQREFPDHSLDTVDFLPVWDWVMACYIGTERERPGDAEIYSALLSAAQQTTERPFLVPMSTSSQSKPAPAVTLEGAA